MKQRLETLAPLFFKWRRHVIVAGAVAVGTALLLSGQGAPLDRQLRIVRDELRSHPASGEIAIVEIDGRSLQTLDRWPWPRGIHAQIVDRLHAGGARSIAFDVDFSARSTPAEDGKLEAALKRAGGSVSLPTMRQSSGSETSNILETQPIKPLRDNAFLSAVTVVPDADSYIRSMPLAITTFATPRPSLAAAVAETNAEVDRYFDVDYAIEPATIPRISAVDLVSGRIPARDIKGKRFIVGMTAVEVGDRYGVPRYGVIPGVVIQALGAETLLAGRVPTTISGVFLLALALLLLAVATFRRRRSARLLLLAASLILVLGIPLAAEALLAVSMPVAPALLAVVAAALLAVASLGLERYLHRALTDPATGLPNLGALETNAGKSALGSVVVARFDQFTTLSAGLGPSAAALLVQRVAERLRFGLGGRDIYHVDAGSLAWIEEEGDDSSLEERIAGVAALMRAPVECGRPVDVALTYGIAAGGAGEARRLVAKAGAAAMQASESGERVRRFAERDGAEIDWQLSLLGELDAAMAEGQLWTAYQPKLDLRSGEIVAVEALVRWKHPERGPIGPDSFIPVIERAGRAADLTRHVLQQALDDALGWERSGYPIGVAVNVSATLLADHDFIDTVAHLLGGHALPAERVTIEVTESAAMQRPDQAIAALESWRALGVGISIDDYGTGQSSLGYLQKLPATEVKVDKSFVATIASDSRNAIMVRSTIELAHKLGMKVVAEGVEDLACQRFLAEMGCDTAQGYHISRPVSSADLVAFLSEWRARREHAAA
ncbi:MAG: EAL domain-containing protein [Alphaproteobacteria bacterium]|nr:EAL domain-containing protein [Alphaproteobacteria bacterium]MBV9373013.1 EAL domain-containing protein [Alphaproteobacteria bacterium]MBV9902896.1 EAL domain-containing protein [Alphaproteobacteria bacterium]